MASLVNQMRNETLPAQTPTQDQMNQSIEATKQLMRMCQNSNNPQAFLLQALQNNPKIAPLLKMMQNGNSLEGIARSMAASNGLDVMNLVKNLQNL